MLKTRQLILALVFVLASAAAHAASGTLYWDSDATSTGNSNASGLNLGGTGTWDNGTTPNWWNGSGADTTWTNTNNDTALFWGAAGTVTLGTGITAGGLTFNTTGYILDASTNTLTFGATNNTIALNNIAAASLTGGVAGSGNVTLSGGIYGGSTVGTLTLNGTSAGGWSGTTTIGNGMTLALSGSNQALFNTSGITLNSGKLTLTANATTFALDRVANAAGISGNGTSTLTYTTVNDTNAYTETLGTVSLVSGMTTIDESLNHTTGSQTLTLSGLSQAGSAGVFFQQSSNQGINTTTNIVKVTGAAQTTAGQIIGPWATINPGNAMYFAIYDASSRITRHGVTTATDDSTWTDPLQAYMVGSGETLSAKRTVAGLRHTGNVTVDLVNFNLETSGWIHGANGGNSTLQATGTGALTTPSGGGNLYFHIGWSIDTISAPIIDNGGAVTVVAIPYTASTGLTLSGANTFTGGVVVSGLVPTANVTISSTGHSGDTVINGGKLTITSDANLGTSGNVTFNGSGTLTATGLTIGAGRTITLNNGALATIAASAVNGPVIGNGGVVVSASCNYTNAANTFTGPVYINNNIAGTFASLSDTNGAGVIVLGSAGTSAATLTWSGGPQTFANRQFVLNGTTGGGIINSNGTGALTIINTDLGIATSGAKTLTLGGTYTGGANTFAGRIGDSAGGATALTKLGAGTWILSGANSYSGATTVSGGTLQIGNASALGFGGVQTTATGTTTVSNGLTLDLNGSATVNEPLILNGTGIGANGALVNTNTGATAIIGNGIAGSQQSPATNGSAYSAVPTITVSGGGGSGATATATLGLTAASFTISGGTTTYSAAPTITISGGGGSGATATATLSANVVSGITITNAGGGFSSAPTISFSGGTVLVAGTNPTGTGNATQFTVSGLAMTAAGSGYTGTPTYTFSAGNASGGSVTGTISSVNLATASSIGGAGNITINAVVSGLGLTKVGAGTTTLNAVNTYTGATTISAGTLQVNGSISTGAVTIGATGALRGGVVGTPGVVGGTVAITASGGVVWPGSALGIPLSGDETLQVTSASVNLTGGGKLKVAVSSAGTGFKQMLQVKNGAAAFTVDSTSVLSFAADNSTALNTKLPGGYVIVETRDASNVLRNGISTAFSTANIIDGPLTPVTDYDVVYKDLNGTPVATNPNGGTVTAAQIVLVFKSTNVTPVKIADFAAKSEGAGVNVSWTCVSEYQNAGFNIYRRAFERSEWVKVNPTLIAGRITNPDEKKYAYVDWASAGMFEYKLESVDLSGGREEYVKLSNVVDIDWMSEPSDVSDGVIDSAIRSIDMEVSAQTAQRVEKIFAAVRTADANAGQKTNASDKVTVREFDARSISVVSVANNVVDRSVVSAAKVLLPAVSVRWFSSGRIDTSSNFTAAKVTYKDAGVMLIPQASMPAGFDLNQVSIQREGRNMNALAKVQGGLMVYAPGYKDNYTDKDALFLRKTTHPTSTGTPSTATGLFSSAMPVNVTSSNVVKNDYHDVYFDYGFRPYSFEPWFSNKYLTQGSTQDFTVSLPNAVNSAANLVVNVWSLTSSESVTPDHGIQVLVNGRAVGEASWDGGGKMLQIAFTLPAGALKSGDNTVSLITPTLSGQDSQIALLHSISVSYTRALDGSRPIEITNSTNTTSQYELYNVPNDGAWVVDARYPDRASLVPTETQLQADGTLRLRFAAAAGGSGKFIIVPVGQENKPLTISARQIKPFKLNGTYLATGPAQFASGVQPLLAKRSKEGIRSAFVDQEQLFDYYNYGRYGPDGIRNAVRSVRPSYLLLVGRTTYDYLNYGGANVDPLCPAFLVSTTFWAQTTSDSAFGDLGRGYPEIAVGRLPVNNTSELAGAVNHIVNYKGVPASGVRLHAVADKTDPLVADFGAQLDAMLKVNHPEISWQENYLEKTYATAPEVTAAMKVAANGGSDLILYSGHGNAARLGAFDPRILDQTSVQSWTGNTVLIQATCTANWMAKNVEDYKSIAIQALTQPQGGISASIGTSTYMNPDVATAFMNQLLKNTNGTGARWGTVLLKTQQWAGKQSGSAFYNDLMATEQLFGDPAMPVFAPNAVPTTTTGASPNATGTF